jgi:Protein of unknown function (DUF4256)
MENTQELSSEQSTVLLSTLKSRFEKNMHRHMDIEWTKVEAKLEANPAKLWSLSLMESTGGEPDIVGEEDGEYIFCDCSSESPTGRRSLCYDQVALDARKENKPKDSAMNMADTMGIALLTEDEYRKLQKL